MRGRGGDARARRSPGTRLRLRRPRGRAPGGTGEGGAGRGGGRWGTRPRAPKEVFAYTHVCGLTGTRRYICTCTQAYLPGDVHVNTRTQACPQGPGWVSAGTHACPCVHERAWCTHVRVHAHRYTAGAQAHVYTRTHSIPSHVHTHAYNPARTHALLQAGEQAAVEAHARPGGGVAARGCRCCGQGEQPPPPPPSRPSARSPPSHATAKPCHRDVRPVRRAPLQPGQGLSSLIWAGCQGWPAGGSGGRGMAGDLWRGARAGALCGRCCRRRPRHARTGGVRPGHPSRVGRLGRRGRRGRGEQGLGGRLVARHGEGLAIAARSGGQVGRNLGRQQPDVIQPQIPAEGRTGWRGWEGQGAARPGREALKVGKKPAGPVQPCLTPASLISPYRQFFPCFPGHFLPFPPLRTPRPMRCTYAF